MRQAGNFKKLIDRGFLFGEVMLKSSDGIIIPAEINATLLPDGNYLGTVRDITGRKQVEDALRSSESFLKDIFERIQDCLYVIDMDFNLIRANKHPLLGKSATGYSGGKTVSAAAALPCRLIKQGSPPRLSGLKRIPGDRLQPG